MLWSRRCPRRQQQPLCQGAVRDAAGAQAGCSSLVALEALRYSSLGHHVGAEPRTPCCLRYTFFSAPVTWCCRFTAGFSRMFVSEDNPGRSFQFSLHNISRFYLLWEIVKCRKKPLLRYISLLHAPAVPKILRLSPPYACSPEHGSGTVPLSLFFSSPPKEAS